MSRLSQLSRTPLWTKGAQSQVPAVTHMTVATLVATLPLALWGVQEALLLAAERTH